jgi:hypothetical protein
MQTFASNHPGPAQQPPAAAHPYPMQGQQHYQRQQYQQQPQQQQQQQQGAWLSSAADNQHAAPATAAAAYAPGQSAGYSAAPGCYSSVPKPAMADGGQGRTVEAPMAPAAYAAFDPRRRKRQQQQQQQVQEEDYDDASRPTHRPRGPSMGLGVAAGAGSSRVAKPVPDRTNCVVSAPEGAAEGKARASKKKGGRGAGGSSKGSKAGGRTAGRGKIGAAAAGGAALGGADDRDDDGFGCGNDW